MIGRVTRRIRRFLIETENLRLLLLFMGTLVAISLVIPRLPRLPVLERLQDGVPCTDLANPPGGNQRSLLAVHNNDGQRLQLNLEIMNPSEDTVGDSLIVRDESLLLRVVLTNEDIGPITFYYRDNEETIIPFDEELPGNVAGVIFLIENLDAPQGNLFLSDPGRPPFTQKPQFDLQDVYLLQSGNRCYMDFEITREQMQRMTPPLTAGKYQIRVYFRNANPGAPNHSPGATATPIFRAERDNQGVWTGTAKSDAIRFRVEG